MVAERGRERIRRRRGPEFGLVTHVKLLMFTHAASYVASPRSSIKCVNYVTHHMYHVVILTGPTC